MVWVGAIAVTVCAVLGTLLTLLTLPGTWLMLLVAIGGKLLLPELIGWPWLIAAGVLAVGGEVVEFGASAAGAKAGGAGRPGAIGALVGGLAGGIIGTIVIPIPIAGTIIGGVIGAGVLAVLFERWKGGKNWRASSKAGAGAAAGKLASTFLKTGVAGVMGLVLTVGAFWGAFATLSAGEIEPQGSPAAAAAGMLEAEVASGSADDAAGALSMPHEPEAEPQANKRDTDVNSNDRPAGGEQPNDDAD
ncbi:MAG: DUF456 family protein [Planctomycetota bacterium]